MSIYTAGYSSKFTFLKRNRESTCRLQAQLPTHYTTLLFTSPLRSTTNPVFRYAGGLYVEFPATFSKPQSYSDWNAEIEPADGIYSQSVAVNIFAPAFSSIGLYDLCLHVRAQPKQFSFRIGEFVLLCNPWCPGKRILCLGSITLVYILTQNTHKKHLIIRNYLSHPCVYCICVTIIFIILVTYIMCPQQQCG